MRLWIDCEFNGFGGELISLGMVDETGQEWYEVLPCPHPVPWVKDNVLPVLEKEPVTYAHFQYKFYEFIQQYDTLHVILDWPEDAIHFCKILITGFGHVMQTPPLNIEIRRDLVAKPKLKHNALSDAKALRLADFLDSVELDDD